MSASPLLRPLEELIAVWRDAIVKLKAGVEDSPSHDLKRMIKERCEAYTICADELERVLRDSGLQALLEAGQAMYSCDLCTAGLRFQANLPDAHWDDAKNVFAGWCKKKRWDRALAKVKGKSA